MTSASGKITFSDFLNVFLFNNKYDIGAVIKALQTKGLFQSLAEPNLVAESGKEASFLAGGEYPIPIAQGGSGSVAITVQYKEYGIRLNFLPIVNGNRVHLKVRPEVSTLDFANAIVLNGFRIPGSEHAPHRDRDRAEQRADLRRRRPDEQHGQYDDAEDPRHRRHPDPRLAVQEQGGAEAADRAGRDDHARDSAQQLDGRDLDAAEADRTVHDAGAAEEGRSSSRRRRSRTRARA